MKLLINEETLIHPRCAQRTYVWSAIEVASSKDESRDWLESMLPYVLGLVYIAAICAVFFDFAFRRH